MSEREDLAGPHPPHILRDFFPILGKSVEFVFWITTCCPFITISWNSILGPLDKFGDLEDESNLEILVDHVCSFVESNQVTWLDKHGRKIKFDRERIMDVAISAIDILRMVHKDKDINQKYYLIAIFGEYV